MLHLLGSLFHFLPGLLQLLPLLLGVGAVLRALHALVEFVQIFQIAALLIAQALELFFNFLFLSCILGSAQGVFQFLQFFV